MVLTQIQGMTLHVKINKNQTNNCLGKSPNSAVPALVLDRECIVPPQGFVGHEVFILLCYVSTLAIYIDRHEGKVALHASSRCIVNFEPQTITAGRAGHTAKGGSFTACQHWVSI